MALGLPYTFTYVYLYSLQIQRKPTKEKKKLVKRFSALRMCATKTYGLISSYLSEKWVLYHWASMFIPRTIYYIIWCFPNSHCNCACKKKQRFAFAVQLNAVSTHRHTQIRYQSTNPPWWKDAIWHNRFLAFQVNEQNIFSCYFVIVKHFNKWWLHFHLEIIITKLSSQSMPKVGESDQLNIINLY